MSDRMRRVNESVRQVLAEAVGELKDPRIGFVTVTGVDTSHGPARRRRSTSACSARAQARRSARRASTPRTASCRRASRASCGIKRTPQLTFEYDPTVERGVRMSQLIDELAHRPTTTGTDLDAVAEAIRAHDRFLVTTHENPDGDALGSLLARRSALRAARQGRRHVPRRATRRSRRVRVHAARRARARRCPTTRRARAARGRLREREPRSGPTRRSCSSAPFAIDIDHHHDNTRFGDVNLIVADASSTAEVLRDLFAELGVEMTPEIAEPLYIALVTDTGRFQYTNTTPKALRLAAELVEAGADVHRVFQGVYESVQFAKLKLLARALERAKIYDGGRSSSRTCCATTSPRSARRSRTREGIIDFLRAVEGADLSALIREPPRADAPRDACRCGRAPTSSTSPRSRASRGRRPPAGGGLLERGVDRRDHRLHPPRVPAAQVWCASERLSPPASSCWTSRPGPSSFKVIAELRRRTGARTGHAGTLDPFATGLLLVLSGLGDEARSRASSASTSATSRTSTCRRRPRPAIRRARSSSSTRRRSRTSWKNGSQHSAARSSCRSRPRRR